MKKRLLGSIIFIFCFWWIVLYVTWLVSIGGFNDVYHQLFVENKLPDFMYVFELIKISFFDWGIPIFLIAILSSFFTVSSVFAFYIFKNYKFYKKNVVTDSWSGININIGELPKPSWMPEKIIRSPIVTEYVNSKLLVLNEEQKVTENHKELLLDVLSYIFQTKETSFVGYGHGNNLYEHTLNVLNVCWTKNCDPLIPITAAAHDAGKIISWKINSDTNNWQRVGMHDDYGALLISTFPSFQKLDEEEKYVLKIAIGFGHKEKKIPLMSEERFRRVDNIFAVVNKNDRIQTAIEKKKVLDKKESPEMITEAFVEAVKASPFNTPKTRRGQNAICFRKGEIIYLLEPGFRDLFLSMLPPDIAAAYGGGYRRVGNISPPTVALINHMKNIGWLVEEGNGMKSECGLWSVKVGNKIFNGVLALKLPMEIIEHLPDETGYEIRLNCPLKVSPGVPLNPADSIPKEKLTAIEKKAKQLSVITGQSYESILSKLKEQVLEEIKNESVKKNTQENIEEHPM